MVKPCISPRKTEQVTGIESCMGLGDKKNGECHLFGEKCPLPPSQNANLSRFC